MKKLLSLFLTVLIIFSCFTIIPMNVSAATSGYYTYTVSNGKATITDVSSSISGNVTIPSKLGGYPVTSIGSSAFTYCDNLTDITIPDSVTDIGSEAFFFCTNLTSITIPNSITNIGEKAFFCCDSLQTITVDESNQKYCSIDNVLFDKNKTILIQYPIGNKAKTYTIPNGVTKICSYAFSRCSSLKSITIPDSVTSIGDSTFLNCRNLENITLPNSIISIGNSAFFCCYDLKSITLPENITSINDSVFYDCENLSTVTVPESVKSIGYSAFESCSNLKSITIPKTISEIDYYAFYDCKVLTDIWYAGNQAVKNDIIIHSGNTFFENAVWHYNTCTKHSYSGVCDRFCNNCEFIRQAPNHTYLNICDAECDVCGNARPISHKYDNSCDIMCNICNHIREVPHEYDNVCDDVCNLCKAIRAISHSYEWVIDMDADCGNYGYKHEECSVCHKMRNENTKVDATGNHTYDDEYDADCNVCGEIRQVLPRPVLNGWIVDGGKWYFYENNIVISNTWKRDSVGWVYLGSDGAMLTDSWVRDSVGWCYVGTDGYAVTNCWKKDSIGWCYLNSEGSMTKNQWVFDGAWYFLDADGYMVSNVWMRDSVGWVYVGSDGAMVINQWVRDSVGWCYVGDNGYAVTNCWMADSVGWCYLNSEGSMTISQWLWDGDWYYLDKNGYMATGYEQIGTDVYYFYDDGRMLANAKIGIADVGADGIIHSSEFADYLFTDYMDEKLSYPSTKARWGYVHAYVDQYGNLCVLTQINYIIGNYEYKIIKLRDPSLPYGIVENPEEYLEEQKEFSNNIDYLAYCTCKEMEFYTEVVNMLLYDTVVYYDWFESFQI